MFLLLCTHPTLSAHVDDPRVQHRSLPRGVVPLLLGSLRHRTLHRSLSLWSSMVRHSKLYMPHPLVMLTFVNSYCLLGPQGYLPDRVVHPRRRCPHTQNPDQELDLVRITSFFQWSLVLLTSVPTFVASSSARSWPSTFVPSLALDQPLETMLTLLRHNLTGCDHGYRILG